MALKYYASSADINGESSTLKIEWHKKAMIQTDFC
jgi:hypothetical protein